MTRKKLKRKIKELERKILALEINREYYKILCEQLARENARPKGEE